MKKMKQLLFVLLLVLLFVVPASWKLQGKRDSPWFSNSGSGQYPRCTRSGVHTERRTEDISAIHHRGGFCRGLDAGHHHLHADDLSGRRESADYAAQWPRLYPIDFSYARIWRLFGRRLRLV